MIYPIKNNETIPPGKANMCILLGGNITIERNGKTNAILAKSIFFFEESFDIIAASPFLEGFVSKLDEGTLSKFSDISGALNELPASFETMSIKQLDSKRRVIQSALDGQENELLVDSYTHILWNEVLSDIRENQQEKSTIEKFSELIDENIGQNYCAGTYAEMLGIPLKQLIKEVRRTEDKTPCNFITGKVIERAKHQLMNTDHTSQMIAYQLGFEDPYYFIKYFKKNTELTPTQFRAQFTN